MCCLQRYNVDDERHELHALTEELRQLEAHSEAFDAAGDSFVSVSPVNTRQRSIASIPLQAAHPSSTAAGGMISPPRAVRTVEEQTPQPNIRAPKPTSIA